MLVQGIFREAAVKTLSDRLTAALTVANEQTARETDQLFNEQAELGQRGRALEQLLAQAQVPSSHSLQLCAHHSIPK